MRNGVFVPMILLLALSLAGCGKSERDTAEGLRSRFVETSGCTMEAAVSCDQYGTLWRGVFRCSYVPDGESIVEALEPESIAGVCAVLDGEKQSLRFAGKNLNAGAVSAEAISPAACLPRMMDALRGGWLLEENQEEWNGVPCWRLALDQSGEQVEKVEFVFWLRQEDGTPMRGEISVEGETVLTAEFTTFIF